MRFASMNKNKENGLPPLKNPAPLDAFNILKPISINQRDHEAEKEKPVLSLQSINQHSTICVKTVKVRFFSYF